MQTLLYYVFYLGMNPKDDLHRIHTNVWTLKKIERKLKMVVTLPATQHVPSSQPSAGQFVEPALGFRLYPVPQV